MLATGAILFQAFEVFWCAVALILSYSVLRKQPVEFLQMSVAGDLGEYGCGCDRNAPGVAVNNGPVWNREIDSVTPAGQPHGVSDDEVRGGDQCAQGADHSLP